MLTFTICEVIISEHAVTVRMSASNGTRILSSTHTAATEELAERAARYQLECMFGVAKTPPHVVPIAGVPLGY